MQTATGPSVVVLVAARFRLAMCTQLGESLPTLRGDLDYVVVGEIPRFLCCGKQG